MATIDEALGRIHAEFLEMPGLRLTCRQLQRLCGIEAAICQTVLDALVHAQFLSVSSDGYYARKAAGPQPFLRRPRVLADALVVQPAL